MGEELSREKRAPGELDARADALRGLNDEGVPYLVAGAYAFFEYTGIFRDTKDLDVFLRRKDLVHALGALERAGFRTDLLDPTWIAKGYRGEWFVDLIFSSGNGVAVVDDAWFEHAREAEVMGVPVLLAPPEEIVWSKAYVCERERYDGNECATSCAPAGATWTGNASSPASRTTGRCCSRTSSSSASPSPPRARGCRSGSWASSSAGPRRAWSRATGGGGCAGGRSSPRRSTATCSST